MLTSVGANALLLLSTRLLTLVSAARNSQVVLAPPHDEHIVDPAILAALDAYPDPVDALVFLQPETADELAQPRLLHVVGELEPQWMTEGDKLRLRRKGMKFIDITEHEEFYAQQVDSMAGQARESELMLFKVDLVLAYAVQIFPI